MLCPDRFSRRGADLPGFNLGDGETEAEVDAVPFGEKFRTAGDCLSGIDIQLGRAEKGCHHLITSSQR